MTLNVHATDPARTCPTWCAEEHSQHDRTHWSEAQAVPSAHPTLTVGAALRQDPGATAPVIALDVQHDTLTPDGARAYAALLLELAGQLAGPALGVTAQLSDRVNIGARFRTGTVVGYGTVHPDRFPVPVDMPAYPVVLVAGPDGVDAWSLDRTRDGAR